MGGGVERVHRVEESCVCSEVWQGPQVVESERRIRKQERVCCRAGDETEKSALENRKECEYYLPDLQARVPVFPSRECLWVLTADTKQ